MDIELNNKVSGEIITQKAHVFKFNNLSNSINQYSNKFNQMIRSNLLITIATLALFEAVHAKVSFGFCDQPTLQSNFDVSQYVGTWFEIIRGDPNTFYEKGGDCIQSRYKLNPDGSLSVHAS